MRENQIKTMCTVAQAEILMTRERSLYSLNALQYVLELPPLDQGYISSHLPFDHSERANCPAIQSTKHEVCVSKLINKQISDKTKKLVKMKKTNTKSNHNFKQTGASLRE